MAGSQAGKDGGGAPIVVEPIERELSQLFTNKDSSWGFEKMFDMGKLYNPREGAPPPPPAEPLPAASRACMTFSAACLATLFAAIHVGP